MPPRYFMVFVTAVVLTAPFTIDTKTKSKQSFSVHVPPRISISASSVGAEAELQPGQTQVQVAPQAWSISANNQAGATVQFTTEQSFHHVNNDAIRRDADLRVSILNQSYASAWVVTQAQATTAYQSGQESATVQVRSNRPGSAVLGLTVTFLQGDSTSTPPGDYVTTVIGTISAH
jgi:hypothetical protein